MPYDQLPTEGDLGTFLDGLKLDLDLDLLSPLYPGAVRAAAGEFQERTSRVLLAGAAATRTFDPPVNPNGFLSFGADLASLVSVTVGGTVYTLGSDFRLWRPDGASDDGPWWGLKFRRRWFRPLSFDEEQSVAVRGAWGYGATIPDSVFEALLEKAAATLWPHIKQQVTGGLSSYTRAGVSEAFGIETWSSLLDKWEGQTSSFEKAVNRYLRVEY